MSTAVTPFSATASNKEGGNFERPPAGMHPAVLVALIDLGTHTRSDKGKSWDSRSILFVWELTAEQDKDGNNFIVGQSYTWSLNKNANLRAIIEGWIGRGLKEDEEYDFGVLLGQSCIVTLSEGLSKKGTKFTEVASVGPPMRGMTVPAAKCPVFAFSLGEQHSTKDEPPLPTWTPLVFGEPALDKIKASHEWMALPDF